MWSSEFLLKPDHAHVYSTIEPYKLSPEFSPIYPEEEMDEENIIEDDAELTLDKMEDEVHVSCSCIWVTHNAPCLPIHHMLIKVLQFTSFSSLLLG